ncbi:F-box/LRR-repeat protein [Trifolium pratense]|uniref:F-box/LRR-repeat protein n=1 Tax=Trifolium pratense TaxID=57577 RepID=A0A2K3MUG4_TRIPR|nr:F-box/LRR-repeat protein [Trifolium pratense]
MSGGEKKKKCSGESTTTTIDSLPDNILGHILSFLPTKEAIPTCLLSKRWKKQWLQLHSLHFNEAYHRNGNMQWCEFHQEPHA